MNAYFVNYAIDVSDLLTAITGGVIGALAGGIPAYLLARQQSRELLSRDADERTRSDKASALTSSVKLTQIANSMLTLRRHVEASFQATEDSLEPWQRLITLVGHTDEGSIRFNDAEIMVLARAKLTSLLQEMLLLADRHSAAISVWTTYCQKRDELVHRAPAPVSYKGESGTVHLTEQQHNELQVYAIPLNNLALGLLSALREDTKLLRKIVEQIGPGFSQHFSTNNFVSLVLPSEEDLQNQISREAEQLKRAQEPPAQWSGNC